MRILCALFALVVTGSCATPPQRGPAAVSLDESGYSFDPRDTSCDGYPRLKVQTMPGTCLGIVFHHGNSRGANGKVQYKMPRTIEKVPNTEHFLVTDMGGWGARAGALFWIKHNGGKNYSLVKLLDRLDLPHGLAFNERDQFFYLGENNRISRFRFQNGEIRDHMTVAGNLPDVAKHMHPLTHFVFDPATGDLYVNSGAPTDHCYQADGNYKRRCPEEVIQKMATIQKISADSLSRVTAQKQLAASDFQVAAQGLRNSMAMAIHPAGRFLIQGENSRDFPELEEPYEEMNVIRLDQPGVIKHYGWPYCFNNHGASPEWDDILITSSKTKDMHGPNPFYCGRTAIQGLKDYQRPFSLIPPHAAPLDALYYNGSMFNDILGGQLLMSWHGHRATGQRVVAYKVNGEGLPQLSKPGEEKYHFNAPDGCSKPAAFNPRGGFRKHFAKYDEIISGWGPVKGVRPKGAPLGMTVANDGSIWIVEDKNKTIVRLARTADANHQDGCGGTTSEQNKDYNVLLLAWRNALLESKQARQDYNTISKGLRTESRCLKCHEQLLNKDLSDTPDEFTTMDFLVRSAWFKPGQPDKSLLYDALTQNQMAPPMPPAGFAALKDSAEGRQLIDTIARWIQNLPADIDARWAQVEIGGRLNIRQKPGTEAKACGQFRPEDIAYIDPRAATKVRTGNITWSKVYVVPGHTRLNGACPAPPDGVYYIAR